MLELLLHQLLLYEEVFEKWIRQKEASEVWAKEWKYPAYQDFATPANLQWILQQIPKHQYPYKAYVLGTGMGMEEWLPYVAGRVHHIRFYLEFATKGMEELQEMLLEEYGMLTEVLLIGTGEFQKLRLRSHRHFRYFIKEKQSVMGKRNFPRFGYRTPAR